MHRHPLFFPRLAAALCCAAAGPALACVGVNLTTAGDSACTVPAGVHALVYEVVGGNGGDSATSYSHLPHTIGRGGKGARITGVLPVTPGETLHLTVGGNGRSPSTPWAIGGGGGGYSAIARPGGATLAPIVLAAGGGGGGGATSRAGGNADTPAPSVNPGAGGQAGTAASGGAGGASVGPSAYGPGGAGGHLAQAGAAGGDATYGGGGGGGGGFGAAAPLSSTGGAGGMGGGNANGGIGGANGGGMGGGSSEPTAPGGGGGGGGYTGGGGGGHVGGGGGGASLTPNDGTWQLGDGLPRITLAIAPPEAWISAHTQLTPHSATLNGTVRAVGADIGATSFRYATDQATVDGGGGTPVQATPATATVAAGATSVSADLSGLAPGTRYWYRLHATNPGGTGQSSTQSFITPAVAPGAPTGLTASPGDASVQLAWTAPADDGGGAISGYTVAITPPHGSCVPSPATATGCTATGLTNGTTYTFTVTAGNAAGTSPPSAPATATPVRRSFSGMVASGAVSASFTGGGATCTFESAQLQTPAPAPGAPVFAHGVLDFVLAGCHAGDVTMTIVYPQPLDAGTRYWKLRGGAWQEYPATLANTATEGRATFTLRDGGPGDDDGDGSNGRIVDPSGAGLRAAPAGAAAIPTLSQWGLLLLSGALGLAALAARRPGRR